MKISKELLSNLDSIYNEMLTHHLRQYSNIDIRYCADDRVPSTGKGIHSMYVNVIQHGKPFYVFDGSNDADLMTFSPTTNLKYRALHDLDHAHYYALGQGTTKIKDEKFLNCLMAVRAFNYVKPKYGVTLALQLFFLVYHDTVGQANYYYQVGEFVKDQRKFTLGQLNRCNGYFYSSIGNKVNALAELQACCTNCNVDIDNIKLYG